jgi:peptide/nickel transport system permease protein
MSLRSYIVSRVLLTIPMVMLLLTLVFIVLRWVPGDPASLHFEKNVNPQVLQAFRHEFGLDVPLWQQYFNYLAALFHGDMGISMSDRTPVIQGIASAFPATLELAIYSMSFAVLLGVALGIKSSKKYESLTDVSVRLFGIITYAIPVFFLGLVLQIVFAVWLHWLPTSGRFENQFLEYQPAHVTGLYTIDSILTGNWFAFAISLRCLILPSVTLGTVLCGVFVRLTRTNMLETLRQDFVVAAEARGLPDNVVTMGYAFKNAFLPILTMIGLQFAALLAGAVLTETTFNWPGIGRYLIQSINSRDYTAVQGVVVVFGLLVTVVSLCVDMLYAYLDPRIRL